MSNRWMMLRCLAITVLCAATGTAQVPRTIELRLGKDGAVEAAAEAKPELPSHFIGVALKETDPTLLAQLRIESGVVVEDVIPDSPAAKAGIKPHDVIVKAGDKVLSTADDLLNAVSTAKDAELELTFVRQGQQQSLKVVPAKRPQDVAQASPPVALERASGAALEQALRLWREKSGNDSMELSFVGPGVLVHAEPPALPDDMKITVERAGKQPPKVTVTQGEKTWSATNAKEIEALPEEARVHARGMLGIADQRPFAFTLEPGTSKVRPPAPNMRVRELRQDPLSRIEQELRELRKEIESLKRKE